MREYKDENGFWYYVDHKRKLATTGWARRSSLRWTKNKIDYGTGGIAHMEKEYKILFGKKENEVA